MSLVILLGATLLHHHIHQCPICAIHQFLIHAKCCSSVPLLVLSKSFKNTATYTRVARFPTNMTLPPSCLLSWWGKRSEKCGGAWRTHTGARASQKKKEWKKKRIVYTKPITHTTIWLHYFKLTPFVANMSLSALAQKIGTNQKPVYLKSGIFNILKSFRAKS